MREFAASRVSVSSPRRHISINEVTLFRLPDDLIELNDQVNCILDEIQTHLRQPLPPPPQHGTIFQSLNWARSEDLRAIRNIQRNFRKEMELQCSAYAREKMFLELALIQMCTQAQERQLIALRREFCTHV